MLDSPTTKMLSKHSLQGEVNVSEEFYLTVILLSTVDFLQTPMTEEVGKFVKFIGAPYCGAYLLELGTHPRGTRHIRIFESITILKLLLFTLSNIQNLDLIRTIFPSYIRSLD